VSTVTSLNNYSFAFNGFVFGGSGSPYQIQSVDGLKGRPTLRVQDDNRGYNDGMFSGTDFLAGRTITINVLVLSGNGNSAQQNYELLLAAVEPQSTGTTVLQFQLSPATGLQRVNARMRVQTTTVNPEFTFGYITTQIQFFCPDPKYYDDTLQTATLAVGNPLGRAYNRTYNMSYGGGSTGITTTVTNSGTWTTYPIITFNGPITNPTFGNTTQGNYITLRGTFTNTDTVVIDLDQRIITYNGSPARNLVVGGSNWFSASVGSNSFYMTGTGTLVGTTAATITWRNAYI
jgi:Phage tail protein